MTAPLYVALLHYPVYKKNGEVITTSITPLDLHDIARSCVTFGVKRYYVINSMRTMSFLARRIVGFWQTDYGANYNRTRTDALSIVSIHDHLEDALADIQQRDGKKAVLVATSAKRHESSVGYAELAERLQTDDRPYLLLLGTGWGLIREFVHRCDLVLAPIEGPGEYNHLSVRSAAAIMLDRLCNLRENM